MARKSIIGHKKIDLKYYEEAYSTENWMVRIYKVKDYPNREPGVKSRFPPLKLEEAKLSVSSPDYKFLN